MNLAEAIAHTNALGEQIELLDSMIEFLRLLRSSEEISTDDLVIPKGISEDTIDTMIDQMTEWATTLGTEKRSWESRDIDG